MRLNRSPFIELIEALASLRRLLLLGALLSTGCASVQLERIAPFTPKGFPARVAAAQVPCNPGGNASDRYIPRDSDELEVRLERSDGTHAPVALRIADSPLALLHDVDAARLRVGLLRALRKIEVVGKGDPVTIDTGFAADETWSAIRRRFEGRQVACDHGSCDLRVHLLPATPTPVVPGDVLLLQRSLVTVIPAAGEAPTITTESFEVVVDPQGWLQVPLLSRITFSEIATLGETQTSLEGGTVAAPGLRRIGAHIENSYARVRAWAPQWTDGERRTIEEVADCLNVATILPAQAGCVPDVESSDGTRLPEQFISRCIAIGVGAAFRVCPNVASAVHYRFMPRHLGWTLVDERGARLTIPYRQGLTVAAATREQYPRLRGRELVVAGLFHRAAYLSVLPDPLGDEHSRFSLRVVYDSPISDDPLLKPGDTVFVDRTWPERLESWGGEQ